MTVRIRGFPLGRRDSLFVLLVITLLAEVLFLIMPGLPELDEAPGSAGAFGFLILFYWATGSRLAGGLVALALWCQLALLAGAGLIGFTGEAMAFAFMCGLALCQCGIVTLLRDAN